MQPLLNVPFLASLRQLALEARNLLVIRLPTTVSGKGDISVILELGLPTLEQATIDTEGFCYIGDRTTVVEDHLQGLDLSRV